jgi:hypothetical protein
MVHGSWFIAHGSCNSERGISPLFKSEGIHAAKLVNELIAE